MSYFLLFTFQIYIQSFKRHYATVPSLKRSTAHSWQDSNLIMTLMWKMCRVSLCTVWLCSGKKVNQSIYLSQSWLHVSSFLGISWDPKHLDQYWKELLSLWYSTVFDVETRVKWGQAGQVGMQWDEKRKDATLSMQCICCLHTLSAIIKFFRHIFRK